VSRLCLVLAVAAAILMLPWAAPAGAQVTLRAMTYNVHWAEGTSAATGRRTGRVEPARVVRDIRNSGAEVVALQEAQSYLLPGGRSFSEPREIARALGWTTGGVGRHYLFRGGMPVAKWFVVRRIGRVRARCVRHGDALLSKRPLSQKRTFSLWHPTGFEGRVLVGATIRVNNAPLRVWATHLERQPDVAACQLAGALSRMGQGGPTLLLADLNMSGQTVTTPRCAEAPARPFDLLDAQGFSEPTPVPRTYPAFAPAEAIDHVLAAGGPSVTSTRALRTCPRICSSDHRPLLARVKLAQG
jgi:endonuclease/exonuclease/phosphatase family metal-dependent hydrolase